MEGKHYDGRKRFQEDSRREASDEAVPKRMRGREAVDKMEAVGRSLRLSASARFYA